MTYVPNSGPPDYRAETERWRTHVGLYPKPDAQAVAIIDQTMTQAELNEASEIHVMVRRGEHVRVAHLLTSLLNREGEFDVHGALNP